MTVQQRNYIKDNWMTLANLIILLTLSYNYGANQKQTENSIETNKNNIRVNTVVIEEHKKDLKDHKPMDNLMNTFVPRKEIDGRLENIEKVVERIEKKISK